MLEGGLNLGVNDLFLHDRISNEKFWKEDGMFQIADQLWLAYLISESCSSAKLSLY